MRGIWVKSAVVSHKCAPIISLSHIDGAGTLHPLPEGLNSITKFIILVELSQKNQERRGGQCR